LAHWHAITVKNRKPQLDTVKELFRLGLRFLSDFERGRNCQIGKALLALTFYGLELAIAPKNYRLSKVDLLNV
jgi:hypothetical protein